MATVTSFCHVIAVVCSSMSSAELMIPCLLLCCMHCQLVHTIETMEDLFHQVQCHSLLLAQLDCRPHVKALG